MLLFRFLSLALSLNLVTALSHAALTLKKGDHICLIGNALGEGLQHQNEWETLLHQRFPTLELTVRNLCFPGDEPFTRIRSENFGEPDVHLKHSGASVILMFFGYNESFAGDEGLAKFTADMTKLVEETKQKSYSNAGPPQVVLVSPIAFEDTGDPNLFRGDEHNARLEKYAQALSSVAKSTGVSFADIFHPTRKLFETSSERLTINGAHLNAKGYAELGKIFNDQLFEVDGLDVLDKKLKKLVDDKNFHWWHRYRAVNGYSIYGTRGEAGSDGTYRNREVMERERGILDQMTANRDRHIWAMASGKPIPGPIDDSNTLPFIVPKTNVGGKDDPNVKNGKLGSLDYLKAEEQKKKFRLAPGYEIDLVASEEQFPELANPVALNFDSKGRLWVATMPSYPHWQPKSPMNDRLLILEDHDQDGKSDVCKVFAGGLHQPTGFEIGHGGVFVAQQPDILFLKDTDGDDREDFRERRLVGFDSADSHHGIAAFRWGPDGGLYFQEGTFKYSQVESTTGLHRLAEGGIWRYDPRTERFSVHCSFAFANPWGHVFDRWGQDFIGDASPGFSYWAAPITGRIAYPMKHPGGSQHKRVAKLIGGDPEYQFPTLYRKRTRPLAGCEIVSSNNFPPDVQGNWLVTNCIGDRAVLNHSVAEKGSGFEGEEQTPIISCDDGNFRPVDVQFGPDGSLYIIDWHNALIGHLQHNLREPHRDHIHGRIWRVTYKDRPLSKPAKIDGEPIASLLELLKDSENNTRYRARRELAQRPTTEVTAELSQWIAKLDPKFSDYEHDLLEALWIYQSHNMVETSLLQKLLNAKDHRARAAAVRALTFWMERLDKAIDLIQPRIHDEHPMVRLEAVRALSFSQGERASSLALDVLEHESDEMVQYTLNETLRTLKPNKVFLEKPTSTIQYQLARLNNKDLLVAAQEAKDASGIPVHRAILTRPGISARHRQIALKVLSEINKSNPAKEVLSVLAGLSSGNKSEQDALQKMGEQLTTLLVSQPIEILQEQAELLKDASNSKDSRIRVAGFASLIAIGQGLDSMPKLDGNESRLQDWLFAITAVPVESKRNDLREAVVKALQQSESAVVQREALNALGSITTNRAENFKLVASFVTKHDLRAAAVRSLAKIPTDLADALQSESIVESLLAYAQSLKASDRTSEECIEAMQLANALLVKLPEAKAVALKSKLKGVTVQMVHLKTVEEQMRFDQTYFAVEAGRQVQIVLDNEDLMPHNLVITANGALREVAEAGALAGPDGGWQKKPYVPKSEKVLFATDGVPAFSKVRLTFTAPKEPGEYPYVCTYPQHWLRMYGVMVVVKDVDAFNKNPVKPKDPIGNNRSLVQNWKVEDLQDKLEAGLRGRSAEIGKKLFTEATCASCHKVQGQGGIIGPELTDLFAKWKGDRIAILREIIEPSHKIDDKYSMHLILTVDGQTISGIVTAEDKNSVTLLSSQEAKAPSVILRDDIDEMNKSKISMMPKGLLDQYTQDEIFEIVAYLETIGKKP
jgi:putative membrane-bound dehydrogenase-like protein